MHPISYQTFSQDHNTSAKLHFWIKKLIIKGVMDQTNISLYVRKKKMIKQTYVDVVAYFLLELLEL